MHPEVAYCVVNKFVYISKHLQEASMMLIWKQDFLEISIFPENFIYIFNHIRCGDLMQRFQTRNFCTNCRHLIVKQTYGNYVCNNIFNKYFPELRCHITGN